MYLFFTKKYFLLCSILCSLHFCSFGQDTAVVKMDTIVKIDTAYFPIQSASFLDKGRFVSDVNPLIKRQVTPMILVAERVCNRFIFGAVSMNKL